MNYITFIFMSLIIAVGIRGLAVFLNRSKFQQGILSDSSLHFSIIRQLKKNPDSKYIAEYIMNSEPMSYPTVFHWFASLFPLKIVQRYSYVPNVILFILFTFIFVCYLIYLSVYVLNYQSHLFLFVALLVYFVSTSSFLFHGAAVLYLNLSERFIGRATCAISFTGISIGMLYHDVFSFFLAVVFSTLALLSSKFSRQALLFTFPLLSLLFWDVSAVLVLLLSIGIAFLFGRKHFLDGLYYQYLHLQTYQTHFKHSKIVQTALTGFFNWYHSHSKDARSLFLDIGYNLIEKDPTKVFFYYSEILLLFILVSISDTHFDVLLKILFPIIATLIIYLLILNKRYNHFGEAYRYIEYNLFFYLPISIGIIASEVSEDSLQIALLIYIVFVVFISAILLFYYNYILSKRIKDHDTLLPFLNTLSIEKNPVIYAISMRLGVDIGVRREGWKIFWWQPGNISTHIYDKFIEEYPFLKKDWEGLFKEYKVTHVICDKNALTLIDWKYDFSNLTLILEDDIYAAYAVPKQYH